MLTDAKIRAARKPGKYFDQHGLFVAVLPSGTKSWRYQYRLNGRMKTCVIGQFPMLLVAEARERHLKLRALVANNVDPVIGKRRERQAKRAAASNTFAAVSAAWYESNRAGKSDSWKENVTRWLDHHLVPAIGSMPVHEIKPIDVLDVMKAATAKVSARCGNDIRRTAHAVFDYSITHQLADTNPAAALRAAIKQPKARHNPMLSESGLGAFLLALRNYPGQRSTELALRLLVLTMTRKSEVIGARKDEFDLDSHLWKIPADRTKQKREHVVPLVPAAVECVRELMALAGRSSLLVPNVNSRSSPMSESTLNCAIERLGFHGLITPHGLRATARTLLDERGIGRFEVLESLLAHVERDSTVRAYSRASWLNQKREVLQEWATICEELERAAIMA
jgi:integrase